MGRNPSTLIHILGALHPRSGVPIRQLLRKLQSSPEFKSQGARNNNNYYDINHNHNHNSNNDKHANGGQLYSSTHLRALLVLHDRGIFGAGN
jgi:hypothetical protein